MIKKFKRLDKNLSLNRRALLKGLGLIPLLSFLPACQHAAKTPQATETDYLSLISPINRTLNDYARPIFTGDDFSRPHQVLWDRSSYINTIRGLPKPKRKENLVIIGGGMSGLMSDYLLRDKKPVILEQARRFGGNAKGEAWNRLNYALGAAYLVKPEQDSGLYKILKDLGIVKDWTIKNGSDGHVVLNGKLYENFWAGNSEPEHKATYKRLYPPFRTPILNIDYFLNTS